MSVPAWLATADRDSPWPALEVVVAGAGVSGAAAAEALLALGARVTVVDERDDDAGRERAARLEKRGARVRLGPDAASTLPAGAPGLVVTSPGWRPTAPLLVAALRSGIPVWGEVELAWRLRDTADPAPWLAITGTNGKTTAVRMLGEMLRCAGRRPAVAGNVGAPVVTAVLDAAHDVVAVELSSFQLHWTHTLAAHSAAVLNVAPDHLDWHGSLDAYTAAKGRVYDRVAVARVFNADDPVTERLARNALAAGGARAVGVTLGPPRPGMLGVLDDRLLDRAFPLPSGGPDANKDDAVATEAPVELATVDDVRPAAPHNVANALAAAALARSVGIPAEAVRDGLRAFRPDRHRVEAVCSAGGVTYVDDSKATNPHAALASLEAHASVVWVAGGLAKGAVFDDLVRAAAPRLRGVVLLGADRGLIAHALARHAPEIPVVEVRTADNEAMDHVVDAAAGLAQPGDTVLLAPACASQDMFPGYGARGDAFAAAVRRHHGRSR
ncbi:MAG: UDP-N-acetylmuramoyl-L-alanine--D-glutamate ligase [Jiangellaceae bacterium]